MRLGLETRFVKVAKLGWHPSLSDERDRLTWAAPRLPVPHVLRYGRDEGVEWLITTGLPGADAANCCTAEPGALVSALARGLRDFHQIPVKACPFDFSLKSALRHVRKRVETGLINPALDFHPEHRHLTAEQALATVERDRPASEDLVVCHGDYCLPNALIQAGRVTGYVDLGELGVADRWSDLAVATWSVTWNLGSGWEQEFLSSYGVSPDHERIAYYRLLYDLVS
jgi:kanamycin kinase